MVNLLPTIRLAQLILKCKFPSVDRAVNERRGLGISPGYYERLPQLLSKENKRKIEPKEIPSCFIPHPLVVFARQLEILVTTLVDISPSKRAFEKYKPRGLFSVFYVIYII